MAQVTLFQRFYITCPSSKEQFKYLDKLLLFLFRTWQVFLTDVEFRRTAHDLLRHGVLLILIQIDFRDNYGIDRISSCLVGDGQRDWTAAARGEIRKRKHRAAAKDFILSPRLLRFARKSYHERFIEAILAPVFRRASPQSRLAWEDLRSYAPSQIRPLRCVARSQGAASHRSFQSGCL